MFEVPAKTSTCARFDHRRFSSSSAFAAFSPLRRKQKTSTACLHLSSRLSHSLPLSLSFSLARSQSVFVLLSLDPTGIGLPFVWLSFFVSFSFLLPILAACLVVCLRPRSRPFDLTTDGYPNPRSKKSIRLTDQADQSCLAEPSTALVPVQRPAIDRVD